MEHRDIHTRAQALLDLETLRRLDVFEIDSAKGRLECGDDVDEPLNIGFVDLDIEHVDVRELLEQDALAFHDRFGRQGADRAEPEHCGAIGYDTDQIGPDGEFGCHRRIFGNRQRGLGNPGGVGAREIALVAQRLGGNDFDFARAPFAVIPICLWS